MARLRKSVRRSRKPKMVLSCKKSMRRHRSKKCKSMRVRRSKKRKSRSRRRKSKRDGCGDGCGDGGEDEMDGDGKRTMNLNRPRNRFPTIL